MIMGKTVKVAATGRMAAALNRAAAAAPGYNVARAVYTKLSPDVFSVYVDADIWKHENADYLIDSGMFRTIRIEYAPGCYAMDRYITTADLVRVFRSSRAADLSELVDAVLADVAI